MSTAELKAQLITKIQQSNNVELLENIGRIFEIDETQMYQFTAEQQRTVAEAQNEIQQERSMSNEQMKRTTDEWIKK